MGRFRSHGERVTPLYFGSLFSLGLPSDIAQIALWTRAGTSCETGRAILWTTCERCWGRFYIGAMSARETGSDVPPRCGQPRMPCTNVCGRWYSSSRRTSRRNVCQRCFRAGSAIRDCGVVKTLRWMDADVLVLPGRARRGPPANVNSRLGPAARAGEAAPARAWSAEASCEL